MRLLRRMLPYDEAHDGTAVRPPYRDLLSRLDGADLEALTREVNALLASRGVRFGGDDGHDFRVDSEVVPVVDAEAHAAEIGRAHV